MKRTPKGVLFLFMREFLKAFFLQNESQVTETPAGLTVDLSPAMKTLFGQDLLQLVFDARDVDESSELVTHGSYVFNTIYQHLQTAGQKVVGRLDELHEIDRGAFVKKVQIVNGEVRSFKMAKEKTADLLFNLKVSYLSDEKSEEILVLGVDEHGVIFDASTYYREDVLRKHVTALPTKGSIDLSRKSIEAQFRSCLKTASARALESGRTLQQDILKRLHHTVARLKGYYTAQIQELHRNQPSYEERRVILEREYEHKLKEEIDNHKLRIVLKLLSFQIIERTELRAVMKLKTVGISEEQPFQMIFDTFTGTLDYGECPTCRRSMDSIVLDTDGRIGCRECVFTCSSCKKPRARKIAPTGCHVCESPLCENCLTRCSSCLKPVCGNHTAVCAIGEELMCSDCSVQCSVCGRELCNDHSFECAASKTVICFEDRVICRKCRKVYSKDYVSGLAKGTKFCPSCNESFQ